ncbi:DUF4113 domain-containing protein [Phormidium tenue FACHB-1052]|nr:DUF4113 domain-containing protein [Phormidium tenue FACHB-1052]
MRADRLTQRYTTRWDELVQRNSGEYSEKENLQITVSLLTHIG